MTGKTCQKKNIGQSRKASHSALPWETKYQESPVDRVKPPRPATANAVVTTIRENNSILPRLLRSRLTNMRQRRSAMAESWSRRGGGELGGGKEKAFPNKGPEAGWNCLFPNP